MIQVPPTDSHVALILIHTLCEPFDIHVTIRPTAALIVIIIRRVGGSYLIILGFSGSGGTTTEKATYGMTDRGADSYTTIEALAPVVLRK